MNIRILVFAFFAQALLFSAETTKDLISNPGFESGSAPWVENNWLNNDMRYGRDSNQPHSGSFSFKMEFVKVVGGNNSAFLYPHLPVRPGQILKISYWARGISNGPPLLLRVRKGTAPYTTYFQAESPLAEGWQEFSYTVEIPQNADANDTQLFFYTTLPGTVWLDDVSVTELPSVDQGEAPKENPLRNASFEVGRDGWTATFRKREFPSLWEESGGNYPSPDNAELKIVKAGDAPEGRQYLSFDINPGSRVFLTSAYFRARYGHPMRLQFSLRSNGTREFQTVIGSGKNANRTMNGGTTLRSSNQWQSFCVPVTLKASLGGVYFVEMEFNQPGRYDLDAVSLTEDENPIPELFPPATSIVSALGSPVGNLYDRNQEAAFTLSIAKKKSSRPLFYEIAVFNFLGLERSSQTVTITPDANGYGEAAFQVPTGEYGAFRITARESSPPEPHGGFITWIKNLFGQPPAKQPAPGNLLAEQLYSVLPSLPPPAARPDSFFGGHVDLTPYNLEIARKAGFRWLRLYPPLITQWMSVEPKPGQWTFQVDDVSRAKALGFHILGNLCSCPDFAADIDPKANAVEKSRWRRSFIPANLDRWKEYVTRTFNAFYPHIDAWEIWNEPDGDYMRFRPSLDRATVYLSLLRSAREALNANAKPVVLIGPAVSNINAPLGWEILKNGGGLLLDAFSFHHYDLAAGGENPDPAYLTPILDGYRTFTNCQGKPLPLWHTEGGAYINGSQSWLETYNVPPSSSVTPPEAAASMVRSALFFKASGVKRYFDFLAGASRAGRRIHEDITEGFFDVTGIPGPGTAAHAAMVALVEDGEPAGIEVREVEGISVKIAHFKGPEGNVDAVWAGSPVPLSKILPPDSPNEIRDMMGNQVPLAEARTGEFPLYVLCGGGKK